MFSAGYTPLWEAHVLAHLPLYTSLMPLFLRQTAGRVSAYGNPVLDNLRQVCVIPDASQRQLETAAMHMQGMLDLVSLYHCPFWFSTVSSNTQNPCSCGKQLAECRPMATLSWTICARCASQLPETTKSRQAETATMQVQGLLAHLPLYTSLMPLTLRQTAGRVSAYGNPVLDSLRQVRSRGLGHSILQYPFDQDLI